MISSINCKIDSVLRSYSQWYSIYMYLFVQKYLDV